jgi:hypothetical protein
MTDKSFSINFYQYLMNEHPPRKVVTVQMWVTARNYSDIYEVDLHGDINFTLTLSAGYRGVALKGTIT